jgi:FG-GAP-like repeat
VLGGLQPAQAQAQYVQQAKLVGATSSFAQQGTSVALSGDGNTAIVGGIGDNSEVGAAWVFTRSGGVWTQGPKLVAFDSVGMAAQGRSVALSFDGNTAIVGGSGDNSQVGAAWVFVREGSVWIEQQKLVGPGAVGAAEQGFSVSLSADGNTAIVGGPSDSVGVGAAWVFTRFDVGWDPEGVKLVGTGVVGSFAQQGTSVALSADGNTAIVGGPNDNSDLGAAWVFTRTGATWTQQDAKIVGTGSTADAEQGLAVGLSTDGNTAIVGGRFDNSGVGAAWVFTRTGGVWPQQGPKLVGTGGIGMQGQGTAVAISSDGNIALVGGRDDDNKAGATWVFTRNSGTWNQRGAKLVGDAPGSGTVQGISVGLSGDGRTALVGGPGALDGVGAAWVYAVVGAHDFNADGRSDLVWRNVEGDVSVSLMNGTQITPGPVYGPISNIWSVVGQRDFNSDGNADLLWRDTDGNTAMWFMSGTNLDSSAAVGNIPTDFTVAGVGDFNGDGKGDILWRDTGGNTSIWLMNGAQVVASGGLGNVPAIWSVLGTGDFDGDGNTDILWRDASGNTAMWLMNGTTILSNLSVGNIPTTFSVVGFGDFNGDGRADIMWRDTSGNTAVWLMNGATVLASGGLGNVPTTFSVAVTGDFDGNGTSDLLWRDAIGNTSIWFINGVNVSSTAGLGNIPTNWMVQSTNAE